VTIARKSGKRRRRQGMEEEDITVVHTMRHYGGSFVQALAEAAMRADPINLRRIKEAFPEYWEEYRQMARTMATRAQGQDRD
jgi:hypothetical protein